MEEKTYKLDNLFTLFNSKAQYGSINEWSINVLDKELYPNILYTSNSSHGINIYDVSTTGRLIIQFSAFETKGLIYLNKTQINAGINYNNGIITHIQIIPITPTTPVDGVQINKITRYRLINDENKILQAEKLNTYTINDINNQLNLINDRLFSTTDVSTNVYNALNGYLIDTLPAYTFLYGNAEKKFIILASKTHLIIYCTKNDKKTMIDRQINGMLYFMIPRVELIDNNFLKITMSNELCDNQVVMLYKIIEDSGIDEKDQCNICNGFTEKKRALVPCGHTQFCETCIGTVSMCPLCSENVTSVIVIH
jgi:hypothetical protein